MPISCHLGVALATARAAWTEILSTSSRASSGCVRAFTRAWLLLFPAHAGLHRPEHAEIEAASSSNISRARLECMQIQESKSACGGQLIACQASHLQLVGTFSRQLRCSISRRMCPEFVPAAANCCSETRRQALTSRLRHRASDYVQDQVAEPFESGLPPTTFLANAGMGKLSKTSHVFPLQPHNRRVNNTPY